MRWANNRNVWPKLEIGLVLVALAIGAYSYFMLSRDGAPVRAASGHLTTIVLVLNIVPLMGLAVLIARRIAVLLANRRRGIAGARLHLRLVGFFSLVAVIPTILVVVFASLLFEFGLQFWFSDRVRTVLDNADQVARAYVLENTARIRDDIIATRVDIDREADLAKTNPRRFADAVQWQAIARDYTEAVVFTLNKGVLDIVVAARQGNDQGTTRLAASDVARAARNQVVVIPGEKSDRVQAIIQLARMPNHYLFVSRKTAPQVLAQVARTQAALSDYQSLVNRRRSLQFRFTITLAVASLLILFSAIWAALWLANRWVTPLSWLIQAAERVGGGDLTARVPMRGSPDELAQLARSFNRMAAQLENQTGALIGANAQLDARRRFIEAVLTGVSAGIIGVSPSGAIGLANQSAASLLELSPDAMLGKPLAEISPELAELLEVARESPDRLAIGEVALAALERTLMVQIRAERQDGGASGYVLTFDDITQQLADQRRAAWSDVARRIAHEIKNPLTPIQLAAERLRRKYGQEIISDPDIFHACTDTIIRQVSDLRRMVDEFSSFARMPRPEFYPENWDEIIREAVLLAEIANPAVRFTIDLPEDLKPLVADRRQLMQCLTNLLKNACEAIAARPMAATERDPGRILTRLTVDEAEARILICDNGVGLPADLRDRLTEPYVTTRPRGTGLGLAIVKKIVEDHSGRLILSDGGPCGVDGGGASACMVFDARALALREKGAAASNLTLLETMRHGA